MKRTCIEIIVACILLFILLFCVRQCQSNLAKLEGYETNWIALSNENNKNAKSSKAYELKISQMKYINDSLMNAMDSVRRTLKVKDSKLKGMGYIKSRVIIRDTIMLKQTIQKGATTIDIDTVINKK